MSGRDYRSEPARRDDVERYGYGDDGRLRVAERFDSGDRVERMLVEQDGGVEWRWGLDSRGQLRTLVCARLDPDTGRVVSEHQLSRVGNDEVRVAEELSYDEQGRLTRARFERAGGDYDAWVGLRKGEHRLAYGDDGDLVGVTVHYDDPSTPPETVFGRFPEKWDELVRDVRPQLVEAVAAAVAACGEEIALVALTYANVGEDIPPTAFACPTRRRDELLTTYGHDRVVLLPAEWRREPLDLELGGPLAVACDKLNMLTRQGQAPQGGPRDLILSAARQLAGHNWPPSVARADDFAVYAVDAEGEELEANLEASVPAERLSAWRREGLLDG